MAARTLVTKLTKTSSVHTIPVACPDCKTDLRVEGAIIEQGWKPYTRYFSINPDDDTELNADTDAMVAEGLDEEEDLVVRYLCQHCKSRLNKPASRRR
jgi:uncharacterized protein YlaI